MRDIGVEIGPKLVFWFHLRD